MSMKRKSVVTGNDQKLENNFKGLQVSSSEEDGVEGRGGTGVCENDTIIEDYEEYEDELKEHVILGFVEKPKEKWLLLRQYFPSKAGGVPAWLDPINLPLGRSCTCDLCDEPLQFLLQVYAPLSDKNSTFHRTLFVFICTSMTCLTRGQRKQFTHLPKKALRSVKVFRCQLPRENPFYSAKSPKNDGTDKPSGNPVAILCDWCGSWKADRSCSSCKMAQYCSENHQKRHWCSGHEIECHNKSTLLKVADQSGSFQSNAVYLESQKDASKTLWPELEILQEDESESEEESAQNIENINPVVLSDEEDDSTQSFMDALEGDNDKKSWAAFQERIMKAPEQVLRYCRSPGAKPLWPMATGRPSIAEIPNCSYCGGHLTYEFQILPQLLYYFGVQDDVDSLDWGAIVVYTCQSSCDGDPKYKQEFAWVQLSSPSTETP